MSRTRRAPDGTQPVFMIPAPRRRMRPWMMLAAVIVLAAGGAGAYALLRPEVTPARPTTTALAFEPRESSPPPPAVPAPEPLPPDRLVTLDEPADEPLLLESADSVYDEPEPVDPAPPPPPPPPRRRAEASRARQRAAPVPVAPPPAERAVDTQSSAQTLPPAPGRLFVSSRPWGRLYLNGDFQGNTPLAGFVVPAGTHRLRIVRDGFRPFERTVEVRPGEDLRLIDVVLENP